MSKHEPWSRITTLLLVVACLCLLGTNHAGDESGDEALVTFMRLRQAESATLVTAPVAVFIDNDFHGELRRNAYLEASVTAGAHLINRNWVQLEGGRRYCFVWSSIGWVLHSPHAAEMLHSSDKVSRIEPPDDDLARARSERHRAKYEKALRRAGEPPEVAFPTTFDGVIHARKLFDAGDLFRPRLKGGRLTIDREVVSFDSGRKHFEIPAARLEDVTLAGFKPSDPWPWIGVLYRTDDGLEVEYFSPRASYNSVFSSLQEVMSGPA